MSKLTPPSDPLEVFGEAYELLLEKVLKLLHVNNANEQELKNVVEKASETIPQLQQMSEDERQKLHAAVHKKVQTDKTS